MARQPRFFVPGEVLHVIQRGNDRQAIFTSDEDYRFFLDCLIRAAREHDSLIHAYVLMTNHVHLLATPQRRESLPKTIQSVGRRYVQYFNQTHRRTGTLWEGRYRAAIIDSEQYLLTCMRYIELNPVRAGLARDPGAYRWTSFHANARGTPDVLVTFHELYGRLGRSASEREETYLQLFQSGLSELDLEAIREATNKNWALGGKRFKCRVEALSGRRANLSRRGRPSGIALKDNRV